MTGTWRGDASLGCSFRTAMKPTEHISPTATPIALHAPHAMERIRSGIRHGGCIARLFCIAAGYSFGYPAGCFFWLPCGLSAGYSFWLSAGCPFGYTGCFGCTSGYFLATERKLQTAHSWSGQKRTKKSGHAPQRGRRRDRRFAYDRASRNQENLVFEQISPKTDRGRRTSTPGRVTTTRSSAPAAHCVVLMCTCMAASARSQRGHWC